MAKIYGLSKFSKNVMFFLKNSEIFRKNNIYFFNTYIMNVLKFSSLFKHYMKRINQL